jgi:PTS system fructose-specific IIC component
MKISDLIDINIVDLDVKATSKDEVITALAKLLHEDGRIKDLNPFIEEIKKREALSSTGVGFGVAIPHAKTELVIKPSLAFGRVKNGLDYNSLDGEDADMFFMIAAPSGGENLHLKTLAKLSRNLIHESFRDGIREAKTKEELLTHLNKIDKED